MAKTKPCTDCGGGGLIEKAAGLISWACVTCNGTGVVLDVLTKEQFEENYAKATGVTVEALLELGLEAVPCDCDEGGCAGWGMKSSGEVREVADGNSDEVPGATSGDRSDTPVVGSGDAGKPKQPKKSKAKAKARKRSR